MNAFDLIILAILVALTLRGVWKGMISQIVSVASFFVCWIVASRFGSLVAPTIPVEAPWNQVLAMAIIFLITLVAIRFAHAALEKTIRKWKLEKLNTLLGGALGFVKGLLICIIITFFAVMFSEISRDVVFNSTTGNSLTRLITQIGVFVPKDSYEFVHTQLALFNDRVDQAVPGQKPETLLVHNSEPAQQIRAQLSQTKEKADTVASASSLLDALSKWWNGSKEEVPEPLNSTAQAKQNESSVLPAVPQTINTSTATPQPAVSQSAIPEAFFLRQTEPSPPPLQPLTTFAPPALAEQQGWSPLTTLTPLNDLSPILTELELQHLPTLQTHHHVGSDQLLRNSTQSTPPANSARVFRMR